MSNFTYTEDKIQHHDNKLIEINKTINNIKLFFGALTLIHIIIIVFLCIIIYKLVRAENNIKSNLYKSEEGEGTQVSSDTSILHSESSDNYIKDSSNNVTGKYYITYTYTNEDTIKWDIQDTMSNSYMVDTPIKKISKIINNKNYYQVILNFKINKDNDKLNTRLVYTKTTTTELYIENIDIQYNKKLISIF